MTADSPRPPDQQLDEIHARVRYIGQEPPTSEYEVMDMVAHEIRAVRAKDRS